MKQRNVSEQIAQFLPLLRAYEKDEGLTITDITEEAGSNRGDNYIALLIRTKVSGKRGDGSPYKKNFMSKVYPAHRNISNIFKVDVLCRNEAHTYKNIIPELGPIAPRCVDITETTIIMQDLKEEGYALCDRKKFVDLEHCIYILQSLASMHAKSLAIKLKDQLHFEELIAPIKDVIFSNEPDLVFKPIMENSVEKAMECLKFVEPKSPEVQAAIDLLAQYRNKLFDTTIEKMKRPAEKYFVLCHGDAWINNMMFKHGPKGEILDMKFIDFQMCRHISPAVDFHYFVYSCAQDKVLQEHYDLLVEKYYERFVDKLKAEDVGQEHLENITLQWLQSQLKEFAIFGLYSSMMMLHALMADDNELVDMDKITAEDLSPENLKNFAISPTVEKAERVTIICSHYRKMYY